MGRTMQTRNYDRWMLDDTVNMFKENLSLVEEDGSIFPVSEDEIIEMDDILADHKCSDLGDDVLSLNTSGQHMHYNFEDFMTFEYGPIKTDGDVRYSNPSLNADVKRFCDGMLGGTDATGPDGKCNLSDTCEDYLLDSKFLDGATDLEPNKGSHMGAMSSESESMVSDRRKSGQEVSEVAAGSSQMLQAKCLDSSLLDKMTIDELHEAFRNMFGRETTVTDKLWLKYRLCFGSQNLVPSNESKSKMFLSTNDQCSGMGSSPSKDMFHVKKKSRSQHVKRERHGTHASVKTLSSEGKNAKFDFSEVEDEKIPVTRKRLRKPTRRYIEESVEHNSKHKKRRCGVSSAVSADKVLHGKLNKQSYKKGFKSEQFIYHQEPFEGACIQVPFGEPVLSEHTKKKVHDSRGYKDSRLLSPHMDTEMESLSIESQEDTSEEDYSAGSRKGNSRRKHNMYWSVSEVLKLVEGVSMYGVGKWTEIKKLMFNSSANRTSVDLKDKWRNLLRASCPQLQRNREVDQRRKHASQLIPESILCRVRELAVIHPYPRERKALVSQSSCVTSPISNARHDNSLALSTAVRV